MEIEKAILKVKDENGNIIKMPENTAETEETE